MKRCWHGVEMEERKMPSFTAFIGVVLSIIALVMSVICFVLNRIPSGSAEVPESPPDDPVCIIYADHRLEELEETDDAEDIVRKRMASKLTAAPDIDTGKYQYRFFFVYFEDDAELYLVFRKDSAESSDGQPVRFDGVSGIEVFGLANQAADNAAEYEGEKIMAQAYTDLLRELTRYMPQ